MVKHFRELRVYRDAFEAAMRIFAFSKQWPKEERYSLTDQIYEHISGGLVNMMDRADQWCISGSQVREDEVEYEVSESLTYPHTHTLNSDAKHSTPAGSGYAGTQQTLAYEAGGFATALIAMPT